MSFLSDNLPGVTYLTDLVPADKEFFAEDIQESLTAIENGVGACQSIEEVMDLIWDATALILPRDRLGLSFIEEDRAAITARYFRCTYDNTLLNGGFSAGLANSTLADIMQTGQPRLISDLAAYLKAKPDSVSASLLVQEGVRSNLTLPLKVKDRQVGFFFFSSRKPDMFHEEHARILQAVLSRVSQAVEKAWLIKRLQDANNAYNSTIGFVSHELKSPLTSIISRGETYLGGFLCPVEPHAEETIRGINRIAGYMLDMVRNYLDLARLESGEMRFSPRESVHLRQDVVEFALQNNALHAEQHGMRVSAQVEPPDIILRCDPDLLRIAVQNLLDNAVKYGREGTEVRLRAQIANEQLALSVENEGVGFTEEQRAKLFKRFSRLHQKGMETRRGSGLGLYLTFWIVNRHGGTILAESEPGQWARFTIHLHDAWIDRER